MGEVPDDDAPTELTPTVLGPEVEPSEAWALDDERDEPTARLTPRRITALAVAGSLVVATAAAVVGVLHLRKPEPIVAAPMPNSASSTPPPSPPPAAPSTGWGLPAAKVTPPTKTVTVERPTPPSQELGEGKDGDGEKPGNPAPTQREMEFIQSVATVGFLGDTKATLEAGYGICSLLDKGVSHEGIERFVADSLSDSRKMSGEHSGYYATLFAQYATYNLCPRHVGEYGQI